MELDALMVSYVLRRLIEMIPVIFGITLIVFILLRVSGDPVRLMLGEDSTPEQVQQLRTNLGLDKPIYQQYLIFMAGLVRGDFGESIRYSNQPALSVVLERLPATLQLGLAALVVAIGISLPAGIIAAVYRNKFPDYCASFLAVIGQAMPNFWLGIMLILIFSIMLQWTPVSGRESFLSLLLPGVTLGAGLAAILMRLLRSSLLEVFGQDYIRTGKAKGLSARAVLNKHALRNAVLSYITVIGLQMASLMAGAVITEQVFAWPGIGQLAIQAVNSRDMAVVQAIVIVAALIVMFANLVVDILYSVIDPRIQYA